MFRWRKSFIVLRRELVTRIRTKAFWISTLAVPALLAAFSIGPALLMARAGGSFHVGVVTGDAELFHLAEQNLEAPWEKFDGSGMSITLERILPEKEQAQQREELKKKVLAKEYAAVVMVPEALEGEVKLEYLSTNVTALKLMGTVDQILDRAIRTVRLQRLGVAPEVSKKALAPVKLVPVKLEAGGEEKKESTASTFVAGYVLMFVLWFTVMMYGMQVMRGVLEEKSSRIVEVIAASLSPMELMFGKILGVGAVGLTQYAIWLVLAMNAALFGSAVLPASFIDLLTNFGLFSALLGFYVLGYFLYGSLYAAIGAAFNSEEEAQQIQNVAGWLMVIPFLFTVVVMNDPDSLLSTVVSFIPFFSPSLFLLRLVIHTPPLWQTVTCFALLLLTTYETTRLAAAIYRVGILSYGTRPTLKQLWRWARQG
ncbi:MAG: ABC transporter permease [Thermoanaerobaculaceae bacterium]